MFLRLLLCQFCLIVVNISWYFSNWFSQVTSDKCLIYYYFKSRNCLFFVRTPPSIITVIWCAQYFCFQTSCSSNSFCDKENISFPFTRLLRQVFWFGINVIAVEALNCCVGRIRKKLSGRDKNTIIFAFNVPLTFQFVVAKSVGFLK